VDIPDPIIKAKQSPTDRDSVFIENESD